MDTDEKISNGKKNELLDRISRQQATIVSLATNPAVIQGDFKEAIKVITRESAQALGVERVGIWLFSEDQRELECFDLYEKNKDNHSEGLVVKASDYPKYFQALTTDRYIDANKAQSDPRTKEFTKDYLRPMGIASMLDAAIRVSGKTVGVICHEHCGTSREWLADEATFAGGVADQIALVIVHGEQRNAEQALKESEARWRFIVENAPSIILLADCGGKITFINRTIPQLDPQSVIGQSLYNFVNKEDIKRIKGFVADVLENKNTVRYETQGLREHGDYWYQVTVGPVEEKGIVAGVMMIITDITEQKSTQYALMANRDELEKSVQERTAELEAENLERQKAEIALEQKNLALQEILAQIEIEKRQIKEDVNSNIDELIMPVVKKLQRKATGVAKEQVSVLEKNLFQITSSFGAKVSDKRWSLTPREIEICNMIKNGLSSKEIAQILHMSRRTVEIHRNHIRKKIGISQKNVNLTTYLQAI